MSDFGNLGVRCGLLSVFILPLILYFPVGSGLETGHMNAIRPDLPGLNLTRPAVVIYLFCSAVVEVGIQAIAVDCHSTVSAKVGIE